MKLTALRNAPSSEPVMTMSSYGKVNMTRVSPYVSIIVTATVTYVSRVSFQSMTAHRTVPSCNPEGKFRSTTSHNYRQYFQPVNPIPRHNKNRHCMPTCQCAAALHAVQLPDLRSVVLGSTVDGTSDRLWRPRGTALEQLKATHLDNWSRLGQVPMTHDQYAGVSKTRHTPNGHIEDTEKWGQTNFLVP